MINRDQLEVYQARARAQRPRPNFGLAVSKPQARDATSLISKKALMRLKPRI